MAGTTGRTGAPEEYFGRELAYLKHELLKAYLGKLFPIIGMSASRLRISEICYVDCFAGPWSTEKDDLADTSIGVSLSSFEKWKKELDRHGAKVRFRALYVEKDDEAFARLEGFLEKRTPAGIEADCLHGDFVALREEILRWCGSEAFAFFFVDPMGWKPVTVEVLRPLLRRPRSEFLINFMYDFVSRTASMGERRDEIATLLGEAVEVEGLHGAAREKLIIDAYRRNLKREMPASGKWPDRPAHVSVLDGGTERPKSHVVYLTTHQRGIADCMSITEGAERRQK